MDIDTWLRRLATDLEALECPPVVIVAIVDTDSVDAIPQVIQIDDVWLPRCTDIVVADKLLRVVDVDDGTVPTGAQRYGLTAALASNDKVVQSIAAGTCSPSTFVADEGGYLAGVNASPLRN